VSLRRKKGVIKIKKRMEKNEGNQIRNFCINNISLSAFLATTADLSLPGDLILFWGSAYSSRH
jgi:hypothetical protein